MKTAEMYIKAQDDGKFYECIDGDVAYSKDKGLFDKHFFTPWKLSAWDYNEYHGFDNLMNCEWKEMGRVMTVEEAEKEFNIKIIT